MTKVSGSSLSSGPREALCENQRRMSDAQRAMCQDSPHLLFVTVRQAIPTKIRQFVLDRDDKKCVYCGMGEDIVIDHVVPVILGGGNNVENLVAACSTCNSSKGAKPLEEWSSWVE